jgi:hypothetical protein
VNTLRDKIVALVDDWDRDHGSTYCPYREQGCIHGAVTAVRAVLELHAPRPGSEDLCAGCDVRGTATRYVWDCTTVAALAKALNIKPEESE